MKTHLRVAHLAVDFGLGGQRRHRVDNNDVDGTGANQIVGNLESLLAVVGLGDKQIVDIHTEFFGIETVEGMLGIDKGGNTSLFLTFGNGMDGQRGFTR